MSQHSSITVIFMEYQVYFKGWIEDSFPVIFIIFHFIAFLIRCSKFLGEKHQHIASSLVPELLSTHPFFATPEPSIDDPAYVAILILVFNATAKSPTMLAMFPDHTNRHYAYLRDSQPDLVPQLVNEKSVSDLDSKRFEDGGKKNSLWTQL